MDFRSVANAAGVITVRFRFFLVIVLLITAAAAQPASAGLLDKLKDPETGQIDIARGPEEWTIYLQLGHAWGF